MKLDDGHLEQGYSQPIGKNIDHSVGYVLTGMFIILCFSLILFGIQRMQDVPNRIVAESPRSFVETSPEIGDRVESEKN